MKKLSIEDLLPYDQYVKVQFKFLQEVIEEKKGLRVTISDKMTGLFESKLTVWFQIQEMIRAEQITREDYLEEMLEVYNDLLPEEKELSMTLFIEIPNQNELRAFNKTIVGIEEAVQLHFDGEIVQSYEPGEGEEDEDYTQSVHYLHFPFSDEQIEKFLKASKVTLKVNHQNYHAETILPDKTLVQLKKQLQQEL
ncbi:DUF3501 family protein [Microaerobacter geothermalis]|uniref:DUF3501 family protein n=1 Tax=Microaerobacter geothermalis TaxID=674972 RepID=UPI001F2CA64C|nr:DUF3501 family protein [Microaerobacter geothermalis]MCF6094193.1 DUF3501 family protein [Microaerobacter geothermalis]